MRLLDRLLLVLLVCVSTPSLVFASYMPFILAEVSEDSMAEVQQQVEERLTQAGFEIVGRYAPYADAQLLIITNDALRQQAARSEHGGYGAAQRVSLTRVNGLVQVAYTHPGYMAHVYRMEGDLADLADELSQVLGNQQQFGAKEARSERQLRRYRYMFGMESFNHTSAHLLAQHPDHESALHTVVDNLAKGVGGVRQVYRIDIPGKDEVVFGVAMRATTPRGDKNMDDAHLMGMIDVQEIRSTAHLPYEILVSDNRVYHLYARFRVAISFPDLSMLGQNSFMDIMDSPEAIKGALARVAGGDVKR